MGLKKHHKWIIGSFSTIIIIFMIVTSLLLNGIIMKQNSDYNSINQKISNLEKNIQSKISEMSSSLIDTKKSVSSLDKSITNLDASFQKEIDTLKASTSNDFSGIIENAIKSVVTIRTDISQGTGFIIDEDGYIITNAHVMEDAEAAVIITYDEEMKSVYLIGLNKKMDICLLKIDGKYEKLRLADFDEAKVGEKVIAIGNPLGLQFSVSEGIISAIHREISGEEQTYIQTDAALNPGNSGGPLINKEGEVIGINNFKVSYAEGMGFALESNYIKQAVNEISQEKLNQILI